MEKSKVLAGIVSYNPDIERFKKNIDNISKQVYKVIIIDNGSRNVVQINEITRQIENVEIIINSQNKGIAYALNQIGEYAKKNNIPFFLTLDQDSIADSNLVENLLEIMGDNVVGIACPYINRYNDFKRSLRNLEVKVTITSGSLVRTECWEKVGGFWNYLFIDEVDHEFCYRLRKCGYKIVCSYGTCIYHIIGAPKEKNILGHKFHPTNHSAFRRYYMTRNSILMLYIYPKESEPFKHRINMIFRIAISILCCEDDKVSKYIAMMKGIKDALLWIKGHPKKLIKSKGYLV